MQIAVKEFLESADSGEWFMVVDNLDDLSVESKYIPNRRGSILFTTRDRRILQSVKFAVTVQGGVEVTKMSPEEASSTCNNLGMDRNQTDAQTELLRRLDNLPLAISQAAAYIQRTGMSTQEYLQLWMDNTSNQATLLDKPVEEGGTEASTQTVMRTWSVTVDKIKADGNSLAIEILQLMSVFDPEDIPLEIVTKRRSKTNPLDIMDSLAVLSGFALVTRLDSARYRLHTLVSFWTWEVVDLARKIDILTEIAGSLVDSFSDEEDDILGNLHYCSKLMPHSVRVLRVLGQCGVRSEIFWLLHSRVSEVFYHQGNYKRGLKMLNEHLKHASEEEALRPNHPDTLAIVHRLGIAFNDLGEYEKALEYFQRALEGREKALGKDHRQTLAAVNNVGNVYYGRGEYEKTLKYYQRVLEGQEKVLGNHHPDTLSIVENIGNVYCKQGEHQKALEYYQRTLEGREKTLGKDHPDTLSTVGNIGIVYHNQRKYEKGLEYAQRALEGREKVLGKDHPATLGVVHNIGSTFFN